MSCLVRERRSISWWDRTIDSISPPPLPLMAFFGVVMMLMYFASYSEYKQKVERTKIGMRLFFLLLPLIVILVMNLMMLHRMWWRYTVGVPEPVCDAVAAEEGNSAWVVLLLLVLLLLLVKYHPGFQSAWFNPF